MSKNVIFILIALTSNMFAQFEDWETITNMNDIRDIVIVNDNIWSVSEGGAFTYNISNQEILRWTNTNGLKTVDLEAIDADNHGNIITGSIDGNIQVHNLNTQIWKTLSFDGLEVKDLLIKDDTLWVATSNEDIPGKTLAAFVFRNGQYVFNDFFVNFPETITALRKIIVFNKRVWLATDKGLFSAMSDFNTFTLSDPQSWTLYTTANGLPDNNILSLAIFDSKLWCGTENGLAYVTIDNIIFNDDTFDGKSISIIENNGEHLLINDLKNIYSFLPGTGILNNSVYNKEITAIAVSSENDYWLGLKKGGLQNNENNSSITLEGPLNNKIRFVIRDNNSRIWVSTGKFKLTPNEGFSVFENGKWTGYDYSGSSWNALGNTNYIYQDSFENIWLATWGGGIAKFDGQDYSYFHNHEQTGSAIVSTKDTSFTYPLDNTSIQYRGFLSPSGDPLVDYEVITAFKEDGNGYLWIANSYATNGKFIAVAPYTSNGNLDLDPEKWVYFGSADGLATILDGITSIEFDDFGRVWIGTNGNGVFVLDYNNTINNDSDDAVFKDKSINDALISPKITSIANDNDGVIWIGTEGGIHSFDGANTFRHFGESGPLNDAISQVVVDEFNNKWIATAGGLAILKGGFSPFEPEAWVNYTSENSGLISNNVNGIYIDQKQSEALIATESGLSIFRGSFAETQETFTNVISGPNPFILNDQNILFTIKKLKANSTVKIFDINGNLIRKLTAQNRQVDGSRAFWNGKDLNGNNVASGIYLFMAFTEDGKSSAGKIAVVRK